MKPCNQSQRKHLRELLNAVNLFDYARRRAKETVPETDAVKAARKRIAIDQQIVDRHTRLYNRRETIFRRGARRAKENALTSILFLDADTALKAVNNFIEKYGSEQ